VDARLAGEVEDPVGPHVLDDGAGRRGVGEVGLDHARARGGAPRDGPLGERNPVDLDLRVLGVEELGEVTADEAPRAGDEQPHR
jgi:hypothetical protein